MWPFQAIKKKYAKEAARQEELLENQSSILDDPMIKAIRENKVKISLKLTKWERMDKSFSIIKFLVEKLKQI